MREINLAAIPNQSFSVQADDDFYDILIKETNGVMCSSITRNGTVIQQSARVVAGYPLIPYAYQETGNFVIVTEEEELPDYTQFGITQTLIYLSAAEIGALRASF